MEGSAFSGFAGGTLRIRREGGGEFTFNAADISNWVNWDGTPEHPLSPDRLLRLFWGRLGRRRQTVDERDSRGSRHVWGRVGNAVERQPCRRRDRRVAHRPQCPGLPAVGGRG